MPLDPQLPTSTHSADGRFVSDIQRITPTCYSYYQDFVRETFKQRVMHNWSLLCFDNETNTAWLGAYGLGFKRFKEEPELQRLYLPFIYKNFNIEVIDIRNRKEPSIGYIKYLIQTRRYT